MTRVQFLNDLYHHLYGMTREQAEQHLTYYAEMLADRMEEGMSEEDAVASMEDVETIARRIMEEEGLPYTPPEERPIAPPVYPDASQLGGGGGPRAYQAPKRWRQWKNWRKIAQAALWVVAIAAVVGAWNNWRWKRMTHNYDTATQVVDESTTPVQETAPVWEFNGQPYDAGYDYAGPENLFDASDIQGIDIQWPAGQVYIQSYNGSDIMVQEYAQSELTERTMMDVKMEGNVISVRYRNGSWLNNVKGEKWLAVMIPEGMLGEVDVSTVSADVHVDGLELDTLHVETTSGEVFAFNCYTQTVHAATTSGDITFQDITADQMEVYTTSGCVNGDEVSSENVIAATASGDINMTSILEDTVYLDLQSISGDIWASLTSAPAINSINVNTTSGDTTLSLPYDMGFFLNFTTVSGDIDSHFDLSIQNGQYIYEGGGYEIMVMSVSGDLYIY